MANEELIQRIKDAANGDHKPDPASPQFWIGFKYSQIMTLELLENAAQDFAKHGRPDHADGLRFFAKLLKEGPSAAPSVSGATDHE